MSLKFHDLEGLLAAKEAGIMTSPVSIDNDCVTAYWGPEDRPPAAYFEMHPEELLEQCLTHLGIPWEHV